MSFGLRGFCSKRRLDGTASCGYARARELKGKPSMLRLKLLFAIGVASVALIAAGCSKKESETTLPPSPSEPPTAEKSGAPPSAQVTPSPSVEINPATPAKIPAPTAVVPPADQEETPAEVAAQVKQLEGDYFNTPDLQKRVMIIYNLSSLESPATIDAVSRLFLNEQDTELKVELVNSLTDIEGENDKKLTILSGAIRPDQPKDVRLGAIDALADTEDKRAIQVLHGLVNDSDEENREAAQEAIEQLQADATGTQ